MSNKKRVVAGGLALILSAAVQAQTACPCGGGTAATVATAADLSALLVGKTVCASDGGDTWQEFHMGTPGAVRGRVADYKRGPTDPVDPTKVVATFAITAAAGAASIAYDYGGGQLYRYTVCTDGPGKVNLCGARNIVGATLLTGQLPCGTAAASRTATTRP